MLKSLIALITILLFSSIIYKRNKTQMKEDNQQFKNDLNFDTETSDNLEYEKVKYYPLNSTNHFHHLNNEFTFNRDEIGAYDYDSDETKDYEEIKFYETEKFEQNDLDEIEKYEYVDNDYSFSFEDGNDDASY